MRQFLNFRFRAFLVCGFTIYAAATASAQVPGVHISFPPGTFDCENIHHRAVSVSNHEISKEDADSMVSHYFYPIPHTQITYRNPKRRSEIENLINNAYEDDCSDYHVLIKDPTHTDDTYAADNANIVFSVPSGGVNGSRGMYMNSKIKYRGDQKILFVAKSKNAFSVGFFKGLLEAHQDANAAFSFSHAQRIYKSGENVIVTPPSIIIRVTDNGKEYYYDYSTDDPKK